MADWLEAYHELRERLDMLSDVSMRCSVVPNPHIRPGEVLLADVEFAMDADGKFLYTTMVPRKEEGDG